MTPPLDIAALRAVLAKATPGPWYAVDGHTYGPEGYLRTVRDDFDKEDVRHFQDETGGQWTVSSSPDYPGWECDGGHPGYGIHRDDAAAIVAIMNAAGPLLREVEAARALIKAYEDEPASSDDDCPYSSELLAAISAYDAATEGGG